MRNLLIGGVLGTALAASGIAFVVLLISQMIEAREAADWPQARGVVRRTSVVEGRSGPRVSYTLNLGYEYDVQGTRYRGTRLRSSDAPYSTRRAADDALRPFRPGQTVNVYYRPSDPAVSVLQPGVQASQYVYLILVAAVALFGLLLLGATVSNALYRSPVFDAAPNIGPGRTSFKAPEERADRTSPEQRLR